MKFREPNSRKLVLKVGDAFFEDEQRNTDFFDLEQELSGENFEKFKINLEENMTHLGEEGNSQEFAIAEEALQRFMVIQILPPSMKSQFVEVRNNSFPKVLRLLEMEKPYTNPHTKEAILTNLLLAYPERRQEILLKAGNVAKKELLYENLDVDLYDELHVALERLILFPEELPVLQAELEPKLNEITDLLSQDDWSLTAVPSMTIMACLFPDRLPQFKRLAKLILADNPADKWNLDSSQPAYLSYIYFLSILAADSVQITTGKGIELGHKSRSLQRSKPLPMRPIV